MDAGEAVAGDTVETTGTPVGSPVLAEGGIGTAGDIVGRTFGGGDGETGLGVVGDLSPLLTSKEVPSTLVIDVTQGSVTTPAASAWMQKMASSSPLSAAPFNASKASSKTSAPIMSIPMSSHPLQGL